MKKLLIAAGLVLAVFVLAPSIRVMFLKPDKADSKEEFSEDSPCVNEVNANDMKSDDLSEEIPEVDIPKTSENSEEEIEEVMIDGKIYSLSELQIEEMSKSYSITHEADGESYTVNFLWDKVPLIISNPRELETFPDSERKTSAENQRIHLLDQDSNLLQSFNLEEGFYSGMKFDDVNLDGYTDIVVDLGGLMHDTYGFYIWDISSKNFTKVIVDGFGVLYYYRIEEGYITNFRRGPTPDESVTHKLIWDGNRLIMDSKY